MNKLSAVFLGFLLTACATTAPEPVLGPPLEPRDAQLPTATTAGLADDEPALGTLELVFFDVGQGDSTLIRCPDGRTILVDAGSTSRLSRPRKAALLDEIRDELDSDAGPRLDVLVITHPDADHYNLIRELLADIPVSRVIYSGERDAYRSSKPWRLDTWLAAFDDSGRSVRPAATEFDPPNAPSAHLPCGTASVWLLAANVPPESGAENSFVKNTLSIVLRVAHGDFAAVLTGDATTTTETAILARYPAHWLASDLLKFGHHGSRATSTGRAWAETIAPRIGVVSASSDNSYGHPAADALQRVTCTTDDLPKTHRIRWCIGRSGCGESWIDEAIYGTAGAGTLRVVSDGTGYELTCENSAYC